MSDADEPPAAVAALDPGDGRGVEVVAEEAGFRVVDPIEGRRERFRTDPASAAVEEVSTDRVPAPVATAVRLSAGTVELGRPSVVRVLDPDWSAVDTLDRPAERTLAGDHVLDLTGPMKLYVRAVGEVTVTVDETTRVEAPDADLFLGARSLHSRPAARVTAGETPGDVMAALSVAGSALKTTAPDRSWPNLRGHPPAIDLGEELRIPDGLAPPVPEVRVVVPRDLRYVYPVAPLSYYLGAPIEAGWPPRLETDGGFSWPLGSDPDDLRAFERAVSRTLRGVFFVETLARSAGLMHYPIRERAALAGSLPFSFEEFYGFSPGRRLEAALSVPFDELREYVPDWEAVAHVPPEPSAVETLPYVLDDLALVTTRTDRPGDGDATDDRTRQRVAEVGAFLRDAEGADGRTDEAVGPDGTRVAPGEVLVDADGEARYRAPPDRSAAAGAEATTGEYTPLGPDLGVNALDDVWLGEGTPLGGTHGLRVAYENRLERSLSEPPIEVAVVCNDDAMAEELAVASAYADSTKVPFEVDVHREVSTGRLRRLLESDPPAFFHYVGHADADGLRCPDGCLDLSTLEETTLDAFLLNACNSYAQGVALLEAGAVGGIAAFERVPDATAVAVGTRVARLLNAGYPLRVAADVCERTLVSNAPYVVVGDARVALRQNTVPSIYRVERAGPDRYRVRVRHYPGVVTMGSFAKCDLEHDRMDYHLVGNGSEWVTVSGDRLRRHLERGQMPILAGDDLYWSRELDLDSID